MSFSYSFLLLSALILSFLKGSTSSLVIFMRTAPPLNPPSTLLQERLNQQWVFPSPPLPTKTLSPGSGLRSSAGKGEAATGAQAFERTVASHCVSEPGDSDCSFTCSPKTAETFHKGPMLPWIWGPLQALPLSWFPHFLFYASYQDLPALLAPS